MSAFDDFKKLFSSPEEPKPKDTIDDVVKKYAAQVDAKMMEQKVISNLKMDPTGQITGNITNIGLPNINGVSYNYTTAMTSAATGYTSGMITTAMGGGGGGFYGGVNMGNAAMQASPPTYAIKYTNPTTNKEIVRVTPEGKVVWADDIEIDEAAEAFSRALSVGAELKAGITERVKRDMRDSIFEDIIEIAKQKGSLNAEDLTYLLQAAKIMEKLKGGK